MKLALALLLVLAGCQLEARTKRVGLFGAPPAEVAEEEIQQGEIETGRLRTADADIYQPSFRILDVCCGRTRLIEQDPLTHHYRVVGP